MRAEDSKISLKGETGFFKRHIDELQQVDKNEEETLRDHKLMLKLLRTIYVSPIDFGELESKIREVLDEIETKSECLKDVLDEARRHARRPKINKIEYCIQEYVEEEMKGVEEFD